MRGGLSRSGSDLACGISGLAVGPCLAVLYSGIQILRNPHLHAGLRPFMS